MRRLLLSLVVTAVLASGLGVGGAVAAPTDTQFSISGHAQYVSATTLLLPVTLTCDPFVFGTFPGVGSAFVSVRSEETGGVGSGFTNVPCTGSRQNAVIVINGGPFVPGAAVASGSGCGFLCDQDVRRIQIVV